MHSCEGSRDSQGLPVVGSSPGGTTSRPCRTTRSVPGSWTPETCLDTNPERPDLPGGCTSGPRGPVEGRRGTEIYRHVTSPFPRPS